MKAGICSGLKPYERDNFSKLINKGFLDANRIFNLQDKLYTWWSPMNKSRDRNKGWRLDYILISEREKILNALINTDIYGSDHCPISIELLL